MKRIARKPQLIKTFAEADTGGIIRAHHGNGCSNVACGQAQTSQCEGRQDSFFGKLLSMNIQGCFPTIRTRRIDRPLFVLGLPRTGSSFLQALLAQDPDNIAPTTSDFFFPSAFQAWQGNGPDTRLQRTHEIQQALGMFDPDIQAMHPWGDTQPEECMFSMELAGWSEQLSASWRVPGYNRLRNGHLHAAFAMHRTVLQHLQHHMPGQRFALKSPGHLLRLQALLTEYPDAMIVQTHRDPARVLPSITAFLVALRTVCCESRTPGDKIASVNLTAFSEGLKQVIEFRRTAGLDGQFHDALFTDIVRDPIGSVRAIYERFNLSLSNRAVAAMHAWLDNPANNTPRGKYTLEQYGLNEAMIDEKFALYMEHFSISRERGSVSC